MRKFFFIQKQPKQSCLGLFGICQHTYTKAPTQKAPPVTVGTKKSSPGIVRIWGDSQKPHACPSHTCICYHTHTHTHPLHVSCLLWDVSPPNISILGEGVREKTDDQGHPGTPSSGVATPVPLAPCTVYRYALHACTAPRTAMCNIRARRNTTEK